MIRLYQSHFHCIGECVCESVIVKMKSCGVPTLTPLVDSCRQIGDRLGPFDVAALPIGAYAPSYFMNSSHVHPAEAVKIHQDLQVDKSMAIHWGTFNLSEETHDEPPRLLKEAADKAGIDFVAIPQGECIVGPEYEKKAESLLVVGDEEDGETEDQRIEYG